MAMLRPRGKAFKIAAQVVPTLIKRMNKTEEPKKAKSLPKDAMELKIMRINDNRGKEN